MSQTGIADIASRRLISPSGTIDAPSEPTGRAPVRDITSRAPWVDDAKHLAAYLKANSDAYEKLVRVATAAEYPGNHEDALRKVADAAMFAARFHPGRFADGVIENLALRIGRRLADSSDTPIQPRSSVRWLHARRRVLHVASQVRGIGGHTRMLHHWIQSDGTSVHSVVLLNQGNEPVPEWLCDAVRSQGGVVTEYMAASPLRKKAAALSELAREDADLVVLHHDGCDVIPVVAFARRGGPPVAVLNHADHIFWLGTSVADTVINLRSAGAAHSAERRFAAHNTVLPIPLKDAAAPCSRSAARHALGIPEEQTVLLCVGRPLKFKPCGSYDFVGTVNQVLNQHPQAHLYLVGETQEGIGPHLRAEPHPRLHFVGPMDDARLYRAAADVYIESFPFGSNTALLEAALDGLAVVPAFAPLFALLVAGNDSINDLLPNPPSEAAYIERIGQLIQHPAQRIALGRALRARVLASHVGDAWLDHLSRVYLHTDRLAHQARSLPASPCSLSRDDIGLSLWSVVTDGVGQHRGGELGSAGAMWRHSAFVAKDAAHYAAARRLAWRAVMAEPRSRHSWRLLGVTLLGRLGPSLRSVMRPRPAPMKQTTPIDQSTTQGTAQGAAQSKPNTPTTP